MTPSVCRARATLNRQFSRFLLLNVRISTEIFSSRARTEGRQMNIIKKLAGAVLLGAGSIGLAGCATGLPTQVSRYQAMPAPAGQTFYVVPAEGVERSLEFDRFAALVAQQLAAKGYTPAGAPQLASMLVRLDYGVDEGQREYTVDPFARSRYGYGGFGYSDPFYRSG